MKEEVHHLIDGELPDDETAELLHKLSVDPEKRSLFRQQLRLHGELVRNNCHGKLSATEETEMLAQLQRATGNVPAQQTVNRNGLWGALALTLLLGGGAGYAAHTWFAPPQQVVTVIPTPQPVVAATVAPATESIAINRDSIVASLRDSLVNAIRRPAEQAATPRRARPVYVQHYRTQTDTGAVTGGPMPPRKRRHH